MSTYATRFHRWMEEVWNKRREAAIDELLHVNAKIHGLETEMIGPADFKPFHRDFLQMFPTAHVDCEVLVSNDEFDAGHFTVTAINSDGKEVNFTGLAIVKYKNDQIIEGWNGVDFLKMHIQLGEKLVSTEEPMVF